MATAVNSKLLILKEKMACFARKEVASREDLTGARCFPSDIWRKMGNQGLLGIGIPSRYGGLGEKYPAVVMGGEALVANGHNMGIALSWVLHLIVARFLIIGFGNTNQHEQFLGPMAEGQLTASFAVSEPETGAHPKYLKTTAFPRGNDFILNGEKSYLTNGPIAGLFVVIARSGERNGRGQFTAFLVPRDTTGLTVTEPLHLGFLRPSPHCGIRLNNCVVPASSILGRKDFAFEDMVKPLREVEDALMMGPVTGAVTRQLELIRNLVQGQAITPEPGQIEELGKAQSLVHSLRILSYEAAAMLESPGRHPEFPHLLIASRIIPKDTQSILDRFVRETGLISNAELAGLTTDIGRTTDIARNVLKIKQRKLGESLLFGMGSKGIRS